MGVLAEVMRRGAFIMQKDLVEFEKNLASYLGVKHAFGVADGSNAISIALIASGIKSGDEVILPSHTFIATAAAVHFTGGIPVLADCRADKMIDPESVKKLITPRTRFILPVQLNGRTCDMDALQAIATQHNLTIVEDAAQALGSKFKGKSAGTFGKAGTISFYPAKLLGCYGDGGAVVTNDDKVAAEIYMLRDHGRDPEGKTRRWGFNSRLDNIQAAILNFKFKTFDKEVARRREIAALYQNLLGNVSQVLLPPAPNADERHYDVYQNYEIEGDRRDELKKFLEDNGVRTIIQWGGTPVHSFEDLGFKGPGPEYTEKMFKRCLLLPMNTMMTNEDVEYVAAKVREFYAL